MKACTQRYDIAGMGIGRTLRRVLLGGFTPYWSCAYGLHLSKLTILAMRHWLGLPLAWLTLRYERQWLRLLSFWRRFRAQPRTENTTEAAEN